MKDLRRLLFFLFFLSGFSALVYEVVWARKLSLVFGTTVFAVSSILAVFFAGLAIGSWVFGHFVDHPNRMRMKIIRINANTPLLLYGLLELGIGLYAAGTPWIFKLVENLQVSFWQKFTPNFYGFSLFTFFLSFLGLIIPTTLMGGTLPVLSKFLVREEEEIGSGVGVLYFVNTLGATMGALLAGFWLIATLGVSQTIWTATVINILIGITVLWLTRINADIKLTHVDVSADKRQSESVPISTNQRILLAAFALMGFSALALEVLWTRVLILFFGGSVYAFTTVLVTFLLGIALGSAMVSKLLSYYAIKNLLLWFGAGAVILGISVIVSTPFFQEMPFWLLGILKEARGSFGTVTVWEFILSFLIMFVPTFLMGVLFPLGVKIYTQELAGLGQSVGRLYGVNTFGGILGSLAAGFLLVPLIGVQKGIWLAAILYFLVGGAILIKAGINKTVKLLTYSFIFLIISIGYFLPSWNKHFLVSGPFANWRFFVWDSREQAEKRMQASELLYYKEGLEAVVAVKKSGEQIFLRINGKTDAATGLDMDTQILSGQLPMLLHPNPQDVLVIGLGSGITLGSVETYLLKIVEAVEIEPAVVEAAKYFSEANWNALEDKRLKMIVGDGRHYLLGTSKKYDIITSEPSNPYLAGPSKLFTKEYFNLVKSRLKEEGLVAQWIQLYTLDTQDLKMVIKTFQSVFPYVTVWDNLSSYDLLLIGSEEPQELDLSLLGKKFREEKIKKDLARIFIENPEQFLSYLALDSRGVEDFTQGAKENTDNHPILEFSAPKTLYQATTSKNIESFKDLRPKLGGKYAEFRQHVVLAKMYFTRGENEKAVAEYKEALRIDPENGWVKLTLEGLKGR
ncbi:MAG: fused MFS/spermidine synthase [Patescibacteria group bacterium]